MFNPGDLVYYKQKGERPTANIYRTTEYVALIQKIYDKGFELHIVASSRINAHYSYGTMSKRRNESWYRMVFVTDKKMTLRKIERKELPLYIGWPHLSKEFYALLEGA